MKNLLVPCQASFHLDMKPRSPSLITPVLSAGFNTDKRTAEDVTLDGTQKALQQMG